MPDLFGYGAELLLRKTPIGVTEWVTLVEGLRKMIKPHLDKFSLSTVGEFECLTSEGHRHAIADNGPEVVADGPLGLGTRGIFAIGETSYDTESRRTTLYRDEQVTLGGTTRVWGLTRNGEWVICVVEFKHEPGYKNRGYDRAIMVTIRKSTPAEVIRVAGSPKRVWHLLARTVAEWTEARYRLYRQADELLSAVRAASSAIKQIESSLPDA